MQNATSHDLEALYEEAEALKLHGWSRELARQQLAARPNDFRLLLELAAYERTFCQYEAAKTAIDQAAQACPPDVMKWVLAQRGHLSEAMGHFEAAESHHLAAHEMDPDNASYLTYAGSVAFKAGRTQHAIELTTLATRCPRGCLDEAWFNLGGYLMAVGRFIDARDCYVKALETAPDCRRAQTRLEDVSRVLAL